MRVAVVPANDPCPQAGLLGNTLRHLSNVRHLLGLTLDPVLHHTVPVIIVKLALFISPRLIRAVNVVQSKALVVSTMQGKALMVSTMQGKALTVHIVPGKARMVKEGTLLGLSCAPTIKACRYSRRSENKKKHSIQELLETLYKKGTGMNATRFRKAIVHQSCT